MVALIINPTQYTPRVIFDPEAGTYEIVGESRPEDVRSFYGPIIDWLDEFKEYLSANEEAGKKYDFKIVLEYFNSTSAKFVLDILMKLDEFLVEGHEFKIDWHYEEIDEDMRESGEEFDKLTSVPFKFTRIENKK